MYKSNKQIEVENSPKYIVNHWRNTDPKVEEALQGFIFYLEHDYDGDISEQDIEDLQSLIDSFLGLDNNKILQGELDMLAQWNQSVIDTESNHAK